MIDEEKSKDSSFIKLESAIILGNGDKISRDAVKDA